MFLTFLNFPGLFACSDFWTYPVKKSKEMLLPIQPYFDVCQNRKIGFVIFRPVKKSFASKCEIFQFIFEENLFIFWIMGEKLHFAIQEYNFDWVEVNLKLYWVVLVERLFSITKMAWWWWKSALILEQNHKEEHNPSSLVCVPFYFHNLQIR